MKQERIYLVSVGDVKTGETLFNKELLSKNEVETAYLSGYDVYFHIDSQEKDFDKLSSLIRSIACTSNDDDEVVTCPYCYEELKKGTINYYEGYHVDGCDDYGVHY